MVEHITPRDNRWGHAIEWFDFDRMKVHGWLRDRPKVDTTFLAEMQSGKLARFKFIEVRYPGNPRDMFFGTVEFVEYHEGSK